MSDAPPEGLDKLIALDEIRQLAERYAIYLDARDLDPLVALYVPDVRVTRETAGRDALRAQFDETLRAVGVTFLQVGNHVIDFESAERARGVVYTRGEIQDGGIDSDQWIIHLIQYHDTYRRVDGHWYFERRKHLLVCGTPLGVNPLTLPPANWPRSQTGMGSVPHELDTWKRFWGR